MNYASEVGVPTQQINNNVRSFVPSKNYQATLQTIQPYEQQRDQVISGLSREYDFHTQEIVQTMEQIEVVNEARRNLKNAQGQNSSIKTKVKEETKELDKAKQELQLQMSKQKVVFDLFMVFGATIVVYLLFRSFEYVHLIALAVLVVGIVYVLQYNAYSIRLFGDDDSTFTEADLDPRTINKTGNKWWDDAASLKAPKSLIETGTSWWNDAGSLKVPKSLKETGSSWWNSASSLKAPTSASLDISKWTSTTTAQ
jgi:hypothetical protein